MGNHSNKIICFDVDGTLVENRSSWDILTAGLGCPIEILPEIYEKTESGRMSFEEGMRIIEEMYKSSGKASEIFIKNLMRDDFEDCYRRQSKNIADKAGCCILFLSSRRNGLSWKSEIHLFFHLCRLCHLL